MTVEILGADGAVLNTNQVQARAGLNRWSWNLLMAAPDQPVLRSIPPDNPYIWEAGRWQNRERPVTHWGSARSAGSRARRPASTASA